MFLNSFNHFRAIAIVFIVAGHSFSKIVINSDLEKVLVNLICGGTALFVFISGFLFHHIYYKKYKFSTFVMGKFKNILIPYILLGGFPVFFYVSLKIDGWNGFFLPQGVGILEEYVIPVIKYYWTGKFLKSYWYIPFIFITFLLSPAHVLFIKSKIYLQVFLILILCIVSIFLHRPVDNLGVFQSVIYFTPIYLIGIFCSIHKDKVYEIFSQKEYLLLVVIIALALFQTYTGHVGIYFKTPLINGVIDLMFIQKIVMCLFFMVFLARFEKHNNSIIQSVAATSFAIYFLHPIVQQAMLRLMRKYLGTDLAIYSSWLIYPIYIVTLIALCILIAKVTKKVLPNQSRFILGY